LYGCLFYSPPKRDYFKFSADTLNSIPNIKLGFYIYEAGPANKDEGFIGSDDLPDIENYSLYEPIILLPNNEFFWFYKNAAKNKSEFCEDRVRYTIKNHSRKRSNNPYGLYKKQNENSDTILFEKVIPIRESGMNLNYIAYGTFTKDTITIFKEIQLKKEKIIRKKSINKRFIYYPFPFEYKSPFE
jgi:hypothetical protein